MKTMIKWKLYHLMDGVTNIELSAATGISVGLISNYKRAKTIPRFHDPSRLDSIVVALAEIHNQKPAAIFRQLIVWEEKENAEI